MIVHWTIAALGHVTGIHGYIAQNSPRYAKAVVDRITRRTQILSQFPLIGWVVAEYQDEMIREVLEPPYRIIYKVLSDRIDILAVVHGARRLPRTPPS
jgi:toxin ParE1/3/4